MIVYTYWEGPMPPYIKECLRTIRERSKCNLIVYDQVSAAEALKSCDISPMMWKLRRTAHRADCIRVAILAKSGGIWVDADTICIRNMNPISGILDAYDFCCIREKRKDGTEKIINGYFASRKESVMLMVWLQKINELLQLNTDSYTDKWDVFGSGILERIEHLPHAEMHQSTFMPISLGGGACKVLYEPGSIKTYLENDTMMVALANSYMALQPGYMDSVDEIKKRNTLLGSVFRYSAWIDNHK